MSRVWKTAARQPKEEKTEDPVTVLVTGFGPFLETFPINTSWVLASSLPALLPSTSSHPTPVHIHVHHTPLRVAYHTVTDVLPTLLPPQSRMYPPPDIILHIGLAAGRSFYALERAARRVGYERLADVDGEHWTVEEREKLWPGDVFPDILYTRFDTADVLKRWDENLLQEAMDRAEQKTSTEIEKCVGLDEAEAEKMLDAIAKQQLETSMNVPDVRISDDAGNYLCGFSYYFSLARLWDLERKKRYGSSEEQQQLSNTPEQKPGQSQNDSKGHHHGSTATSAFPQADVERQHRHLPCAAFLHVPDLTYSDEAMETGRRAVIGLIRALVDSRANVGVREGGGEKEKNFQGERGESAIVMDANFR